MLLYSIVGTPILLSVTITLVPSYSVQVQLIWKFGACIFPVMQVIFFSFIETSFDCGFIAKPFPGPLTYYNVN